MDPDADPLDWDYAGLSAWAGTAFGVKITASQLKTLDREHIAETLVDRALTRLTIKIARRWRSIS